MRGSARIAAVIAVLLVGSITVAFGGVPVFPGTGGGGSSGVSSLNGQTGVVTAPLVEANATALAAQASAGLSDGAEAYVVTLKAMFVLQASTTTPVALVNVAASGKSGYQWIRQLVRNPVWEQQAAYWVDPQNGAASDENSCTSSGAPCVTLVELSRRLSWAVFPVGVTVTVTQASSGASTDAPLWTWNVQPGSASGGMTIACTPGAAIYTGSVTTFVQQVQGSVATATDNELTDSSIPVSYTASGLLGSGIIYQRTNGTAAWWFPLKDLGSKTLRMSDATNVASSAILALATSDTYSVLPLTKVYDQAFGSVVGQPVARLTISLCDYNGTGGGGSTASRAINAPITWDRCTFSTLLDMSNQTLANCDVVFPNAARTAGIILIKGGAFVNPSKFAFAVNFDAVVQTLLTPQFEGGGLSINGSGSSIGTIAFYDNTSAAFQVVTGVAQLSAIKGVNNTGKLIRVTDVSAVVGYNSTTAPPCVAGSSSDASPVQAGDPTIPGTSVACSALPLTAEITTRMNAVVPF